jgi:hypothetical protein
MDEAQRTPRELPPGLDLLRNHHRCGTPLAENLQRLRRVVVDCIICDLIEQAEGWADSVPPA